jgi:flagellar motility protein MotE (MotC chaperone)
MKYLPQIIELADGTKCVALEDFRRECDEAREAIRALAEHGESEIQRITKERDEARDESLEQARLLGISGEWGCKLIAERDEVRAITKEAITGLYNLGDYDLANKLSGKLEGPK